MEFVYLLIIFMLNFSDSSGPGTSAQRVKPMELIAIIEGYHCLKLVIFVWWRESVVAKDEDGRREAEVPRMHSYV